MSFHALDSANAAVPLLELVTEAVQTGEVVLTQNGHAVAKIVPVAPAKPRRRFGSAKGKLTVPDNFDAPLDDFKDYM